MQYSTQSAPVSTIGRIWKWFQKNNFCRKFSLRVHKFSFQWDLVLHFCICIASLTPFFFTGDRIYAIIPLSIWLFYHILFYLGPRQANLVIPGFGRLKHSFQSTIEDFFSPKLLPVLSISFLLVTLTLTVTGHRLGGPPLCYQSCSLCLSSWSHSIPLISPAHNNHNHDAIDRYTALYLHSPERHGCGYANGKEFLSFYTMAQTSFLLFVTIMIALSICLAWRMAEEETADRITSEDMFKTSTPSAYELRQRILQAFGSPGSAIRPEGSATWIVFGVIVALTFTLLGWHHWSVLPQTPTTSLLILLNLLTILMTILILHLSFFGRIIALYQRNYHRVTYLSNLLYALSEKEEIDAWWNCRNYVLNDDLSLDYDIGGIAVSATFIMNCFLFMILIIQVKLTLYHYYYDVI